MNHNEAWAILGVLPSASKSEITRAYRKLAMKHHPDRGGDERKFKELQEALRTLDREPPKEQPREQKQQHYENNWELPKQSKQNRPPIDDLDEDFIGTMNGANFRATKSSPNGTVTVLQLTIQEAFAGCTKSVPVSNRHSLSGTPTAVKIPAGCDAGKLVATFRNGIEKHDVFIKIVSTWQLINDRNNLIHRGEVHNDLHIPVVTMIVGGTIKATMIDGGEVLISIPAGLQSNTRLRIRNRGYWTEQGSAYRGDCILKAVPIIQTLNSMSLAERELLRRGL